MMLFVPADGWLLGRDRGHGSPLQREVEVMVTRVLQTVAGRMVFAHPRVRA